MHRGVERGLRVAGICLAAVIYLFTGLPSCAGHAAYFRQALMDRAECAGTVLDALGCALAVVMIWVATKTRGRANLWVLVGLAVFLLAWPMLGAVVNCTVSVFGSPTR